MSKTLESVKLYARVALLRRRVLLAHALRRAIAALAALAAAIVALGLGTRVAYLALLPRFGEIGATAIVGGAYLAAALIFGLIALRTPRSDELAALEQMEAETRARAQGAFDSVRLAGAQAEGLAGKAMMGFGLLRAIRRALRSRG